MKLFIIKYYLLYLKVTPLKGIFYFEMKNSPSKITLISTSGLVSYHIAYRSKYSILQLSSWYDSQFDPNNIYCFNITGISDLNSKLIILKELGWEL